MQVQVRILPSPLASLVKHVYADGRQNNRRRNPDMTIDSSDKDAYTEASEADTLRSQITKAANDAINFAGVDRDWANAWLRKLGAEPITGNAEYRMNVPVTGVYGFTINAASRAEATQAFLNRVRAVADAGQINHGVFCENFYQVKFQEPVSAADVTFFAGPEDPEPSTGPVPSLDTLKTEIRKMLMEGVAEQGWGYSHAKRSLAAMNLEPMPAFGYRTVAVPVAGTATVRVPMFEGVDEADVQVAASRYLRRKTSVVVKPEEMGTAVLSPAEDVDF